MLLGGVKVGNKNFLQNCLILKVEICIMRGSNGCAPVAQLDRVLGYEPRGRAFESLRARQ